MSIQELRAKKESLLIEFDELAKVKKQLYSNVDISSPMSIEEKELNHKISSLFSEINSIVIQIRKSNQ